MYLKNHIRIIPGCNREVGNNSLVRFNVDDAMPKLPCICRFRKKLIYCSIRFRGKEETRLIFLGGFKSTLFQATVL